MLRMQCRSCGTEIAHKAIVCYRCGAATTDPVRRAVPVRRPRGPRLLLLAAAAILILAALCAGAVAPRIGDPASWRLAALGLALAAAVFVLVGLLRKRR